MSKFGYPESTWKAAKAEIKQALVQRAKVRGLIPYSELVGHIQSIDVSAYDQRSFHLLGELSADEDAAGRGMLSALVVHKQGDMEPGPGFFELGKQLGRDTSDLLRCWVEEVKKVHAYWGKN